MKKIFLTRKDGEYLADRATGEHVARWHPKKCTWIYLKKFERAARAGLINRGDTAGAELLADFVKRNPNWHLLPDITVTWKCESYQALAKAWKISEIKAKQYAVPYSWMRTWGHLDYTFHEAVEKLAQGYVKSWYEHADSVAVTYVRRGGVTFSENVKIKKTESSS